MPEAAIERSYSERRSVKIFDFAECPKMFVLNLPHVIVVCPEEQSSGARPAAEMARHLPAGFRIRCIRREELERWFDHLGAVFAAKGTGDALRNDSIEISADIIGNWKLAASSLNTGIETNMLIWMIFLLSSTYRQEKSHPPSGFTTASCFSEVLFCPSE